MTVTPPRARDSFVVRLAGLLRRVIGAPDYGAYLRHVAERHPECVPLTEEEFQEERLQARYSTPGNRCC